MKGNTKGFSFQKRFSQSRLGAVLHELFPQNSILFPPYHERIIETLRYHSKLKKGQWAAVPIHWYLVIIDFIFIHGNYRGLLRA